MAADFKILIVDDDAEVRSFLGTVLTAEGYKCEMANDVHSAANKLQQQKFDVAFLDLCLGPANGFNVLDFVKILQPQCACVMMTAHATMETFLDARDGGAIEYLGKPLLIDRLLTVVRKIHAKRYQPQYY